jgi:hypothetical protein
MSVISEEDKTPLIRGTKSSPNLNELLRASKGANQAVL